MRSLVLAIAAVVIVAPAYAWTQTFSTDFDGTGTGGSFTLSEPSIPDHSGYSSSSSGGGGGGGSHSSGPSWSELYAQARNEARQQAERLNDDADSALSGRDYEGAIKLYDKALNVYYTKANEHYYDHKKRDARQAWVDAKWAQVVAAVNERRYKDLPSLLDDVQRVWYTKDLQRQIDQLKKDLAGHGQADKLAAAFCKATMLSDNDKNALKAVGLESAAAAERFEAYAEASQEQHDALVKKRNDMAFEVAFAGAEVALKKGATTITNANAAAAMKYLRKNAKTKDEKAFLTTLGQLVKRRMDRETSAEALVFAAKTFKEDADGLEAAQKDPKNDGKIAVATALKILLPVASEAAGTTAPVGLAVTAAELSESAAYYYYITGEVDGLEKMPNKLTQLAVLDKQLRRHIAQVKDARKAYQKATGRTTDPSCSNQIAER